MTDMRKNNAMRVDNHSIQWRGGVCNKYTYTESVEEKNMMKKGKKWRRKENGGKGVAAGFELGTIAL